MINLIKKIYRYILSKIIWEIYKRKKITATIIFLGYGPGKKDKPKLKDEKNNRAITDPLDTISVIELMAIANALTDEKNYSEAVQWYKLAANRGYYKAQHNLGVMYGKGLGVTQSYSEAVKLYRLAVDQGIAHAQHNSGNMYRLGQGVKRSYSEAVKLYRLAVDQGLVHAQYNLGYMYAKGYGVTQSDTEAIKYYRLAADQGDLDAKKIIRQNEE